MTTLVTAGFHHITLVASDARRTLAFYRDVLGLRLVKRTVNFDDPGAYHLYFGDATGAPGRSSPASSGPRRPVVATVSAGCTTSRSARRRAKRC